MRKFNSPTNTHNGDSSKTGMSLYAGKMVEVHLMQKCRFKVRETGYTTSKLTSTRTEF